MLLRAGLSRDEIQGLRERHHLVSVFPGVYVIGFPRLTQREFLRASVMHCGPRAFASGRTGLELRTIMPVDEGFAWVTTLRRNLETPVRTLIPISGRGRGELTISQSTPTKVVPVETVAGFETTLLPRTLVDFAAVHDEWLLRRAWKEAEFLCRLDPDAIEAEVGNGSRRRGAPLVRKRLRDAYPLTRPGMDLRSRKGELLFLSVIRDAGLPMPEVNARVLIGRKWFLIDFYWRELGFAVEVDGPQHDVGEHAEDDKARDIDFFNAEIDVLRFSTVRLLAERGACVVDLEQAYRRQLRRASSRAHS
jgi:very-short-patch-repair endonuclease